MAHASLRRLLLATEGTPHDAGAEQVALALARATGAALTIVLPFATNEELLGTQPDLALQAEAAAGAALRRVAATAAGAGVLVEAVIRRGNSLVDEIVAATAAHGVDLLVTRRVGKRGLLARLLIGEMVSQVAARVACPMLMAPATATGLWDQRVLLPQSMRGGAGEDVAAALAAAAGVTLELPAGELAQVIAGATRADLVAIALQRVDVAGGRLSNALEGAIGAAPCPTVLVPAAPGGPGRA